MQIPRFNDYRVTEDGVMVADIGFKRQLRALDPELDVVWDWGAQKWEIWRFPGQGKALKKKMDEKAFHCMTIQTRGKQFRELGADILLNLQQGDPHRYTLKQLIDYFDEMDRNVKRARTKDLLNHLHGVTTEFADYMRGVLKVQVPRNAPIIKSSWTHRVGQLVGG